MRALLLSSLRGFGGGEEWFVSACRLLRERGHHALVGARRGSDLAREASTRGLPVVELPLGGDFDPRSIVAVHRLLAREAIDVVVVNHEKELRVAAFASSGPHPPALVPRRGSHDRIKDTAFNRWLYGRRVARLLVNSEALIETVAGGFPALPKSRVVLLPNGADPVEIGAVERAEHEARWPAGDGPRLVTVGELSERKDQEGIVEALARVDRPWRLLVIGEGAARPAIGAAIARLGLGARVRLAGFVRGARRIAACADLAVHFSSNEGQPWAVLETLAQGVPTIATLGAGLEAALENGVSGRLVPPGDRDALASAVSELLADPARARALGETARERMAQTHSDAALGDRLERILETARLSVRPRLRGAVFVDRDGTLTPEAGALGDPERVRLLPGAAAALRVIERAGYAPIVVTNQAAIGRGLVRPDAVRAVHARLRELLRSEGVELAGIFVCPHRPEDRCACRKPNPGLIEDALVAYGLDAKSSWLVGDTIKDLLAAERAGVTPVLLQSGWAGQERLDAARMARGEKEEAPAAVRRAPDLLAFAETL